MFFPITTYHPTFFSAHKFTHSVVQASGDYFLASFLKGDKKKERMIFALGKAGIAARLVPDTARSWSYYEVFQLYAPEGVISHALLSDLLSHEGPGLSPSLCGKGFMEGSFVLDPCTPENGLRIVRMDSLEGFTKMESRSGPIAIMQKLGLIDQALPLTNFHFKVRLCPNITDELFFELLANFDSTVPKNNYHSFFNGPKTALIHPPPLAPPPRPRNAHAHFVRSALVLVDPPLRFSLREAREWGEGRGLSECSAYWANFSHNGTCGIVLEFFMAHDFVRPHTIDIFGRNFILDFFEEAPRFNKVELESKSICGALLEICGSEKNTLPAEADASVKRILAGHFQ